MSKLFWQISSTLDGFMEEPGRDLAHTAEVADPEFEKYASEMLEDIGGFVIGRKTYDVFVEFWPKQTGKDADRLNSLPKLVASHSINETDWNNSRAAGDNLIEAIEELKASSGKDIAIFGSSQLACSLLGQGQIDEIRIFTTPYVVGSGTRTFPDSADLSELKLIKAETWPSGIVAAVYQTK